MRAHHLTPLLLFLATSWAHAADWYVPDDFPTIQSAVNLAADGDTIHVRPGVYRENVVFSGNAYLTLESTDGPSATWIDGMRLDSVLTLYGSGSLIRGFTITNGESTGWGGGGIYQLSGSYHVEDCWLIANVGSQGGGGYVDAHCRLDLTNCLIAGNDAGQGGAVYVGYRASVDVSLTTVVCNGAWYPGSSGGIHAYDCTANVSNSIVWGNSGGQIYDEYAVAISVTYSDIEGGWPGDGNLDVDPFLSGAPDREFYLRQDPPDSGIVNACVDAGNDTADALGMGTRWTRSDMVFDSGVVDIGYHYGSIISNPADTLLVPETYPTIQAGIDAAHAGDVVLVSPGVYHESIDLLGKAIAVESRGGPQTTIIDGGGNWATFYFGSQPSTYYSVLDGFTVTGGENGIVSWTGDGGSGQVRRNLIVGNSVRGVLSAQGHLVLSDNIIAANSGPAIDADLTTLRLRNNLIVGNDGVLSGAYEVGAVYLTSSRATVRFTTIAVNTCGQSGAINLYDTSLEMVDSIIWGNQGSSIELDSGAVASVSYCDVEGGYTGIGNLDASPLLLDPAHRDFHLAQDPTQPGVDNPCVDAGSAEARVLDVDHLWTRSDGIVDSGPADIGFHHWREDTWPGSTVSVPTDYPTIQAAIDASSLGDTIVVSPGLYRENLVIPGLKPLTVVGVAGPAATVVDGGALGATVTFAGATTYYSILEGFKITGGSQSGVWTTGSPHIRRCAISGNWSSDSGGGVYATGRLTIANCLIAGNLSASLGGGICTRKETNMSYTTIVGNSASSGGGSFGPIIMNNSIVWGNFPDAFSWGSDVPVAVYSDVEGGWPGVGNIDGDPLIKSDPWYRMHSAWIWPFHLAAGSPCIDAGADINVDEPWTDIEGDARLVGVRPDMGCDEAARHLRVR